jgi:prophage antirepressor-like protein
MFSDTQIVTHNHEKFGAMRMFTDEHGEPWFVAKDICESLDIKNTTQALQNLDDDERSIFNIGRQGKTNIINESGLYSLIIQSRKPEAKAFRKWVTSEVLPSIRKYGVYRKDNQAELTEESFIEHNGSFWLDTETIAQQLRYMGFEEPTDHIEVSYDNHKDFLSNYFAKIKGQNCFRDYGIVYLLLIVSVEVSKKKEEIQRLCTRVEGLLESLKGKSTKHIKVAAVRAYQEVVSRITATGNDVGFISNLVRYKRKELTTGEIAVLTGQSEEDVAVYLEELEASGIMDMADLLEGAAASAACLPPSAVKKMESAEASQASLPPIS